MHVDTLCIPLQGRRQWPIEMQSQVEENSLNSVNELLKFGLAMVDCILQTDQFGAQLSPSPSVDGS